MLEGFDDLLYERAVTPVRSAISTTLWSAVATAKSEQNPGRISGFC